MTTKKTTPDSFDDLPKTAETKMTADDIGDDVVNAPAFTDDTGAAESPEDHPENRVLPSMAVPSDCIALDAFAASKWGKGQDQAAGFISAMRRSGDAEIRRTREAWEAKLAEFEQRPVNG